MDAHTNVCMVLCLHAHFLHNRQYVFLTHTIVREISIAPTASFQWIFSETHTEEKQNAVERKQKKKRNVPGRETDGTGANIAHGEAKQRSQCQAHGGVCARAEIFRRLKTVVALRVHIHHRGDCCVCPKERAVRV